MMTLTEYKEAKKLLKTSYQKDERDLEKLFAERNNPVVKGDVIADDYKRIIVKMYYVEISYGDIPFLVYEGERLTEDGKPCTDDDVYNTRISQIRMKYINGKPYKYNPYLFSHEKEV